MVIEEIRSVLPIIVGLLIIYGFYKFFTRNKMEENNEEDLDGESEDELEENEEEETEDSEFECENCKETFTDQDKLIFFDDDCDEDSYNVIICKKCIDKAYSRSSETKIEYKEKIVEKPICIDKEGIPINTTFNPNAKSKFD